MEMVKGMSWVSPRLFKTRAFMPLKTKASMPLIALFLFLLFTQDVVLAAQPPNIVLIVIDDLGKKNYLR